MENVKNLLGKKIEFEDNAYDVLKKADALIIMTEWAEFRSPDFEKIAKLLNHKVIFDGRNVFEPQQMKELNFIYESIGRKSL
jgi:UDPglucose 6-dehydrogenase